MKNFYSYFFLFFMIGTTACFAQGWQMVYQDTFAWNQGFHAEQTADGGYIFVGESDYPTGAIRHYIHLLKTDEEGNKLWGKTLNTGMILPIECSEGRSVQQTSDGGFLIGGSTQFDANYSMMLLSKTDSNGDTIWTQRIAPPLMRTYGRSVLIDANGDYVIAGRSVEVGSGVGNILFAKTNSNGTLLWTKQYFNDGNHSSELQAIKAAGDDAYILTGTLDNKFFVMKTDLQGDSLWSKSFTLSTGDYAYAIAMNPDGTYILGGTSSGFAGYFPMIIKLSATGEKLWESAALSLSQGGGISDLIIDDEQKIVVTGSKHSFGGADAPHGFLAKLDMNGDEIWMNDFTPIQKNYQGSSVRQTTDGGYIVGGSSSAGMLLLKTNRAGEFESTNATSSPSKIQSLQIIPNPASEFIEINLGKQTNGFFMVNLFDSKGMQVCGELLLAKEGKINFQVQDLAKAAYVLQVKQGEKIIGVGKVIIQ